MTSLYPENPGRCQAYLETGYRLDGHIRFNIYCTRADCSQRGTLPEDPDYVTGSTVPSESYLPTTINNHCLNCPHRT